MYHFYKLYIQHAVLYSVFGNIKYASDHVQVCSGNDNNFVVINQKGIDPLSLDLLARAGVSCALFITVCPSSF